MAMVMLGGLVDVEEIRVCERERESGVIGGG